MRSPVSTVATANATSTRRIASAPDTVNDYLQSQYHISEGSVATRITTFVLSSTAGATVQQSAEGCFQGQLKRLIDAKYVNQLLFGWFQQNLPA